jgi:hypothetical protein
MQVAIFKDIHMFLRQQYGIMIGSLEWTSTMARMKPHM